MNQHPWEDPQATGYSRQVSEEEYAAFVRRVIEGRRNSNRSVLGRDSNLFVAFLEFADRNQLFTTRDDWHGGEIWGFHLAYQRMDRGVVVRIRQADWFEGWMCDIRSEATWIGGPENSYVVANEYRWFGASSLCPSPMIVEMLEMALADAKRYTTDDLDPRPRPTYAVSRRHW